MTEIEHEQTAPAADVTGAEKPFGPAAAAILAGGFASMVLGLVTSLAEGDKGTADALTFSDKVGPLSGKTIVTTCVLFASWALLAVVFRRRSPLVGRVLIAAVVMLALGVLGTFPTFFEIFASD